MNIARSPLSITISVWKALFLREAVSRISHGRVAWLWLLLEPVVHIVFMMFVFTVIRLRTVNGMDVAVWLMIGLLALLMFTRTGKQTENAIGANQGLFTYRQVKPVDTVLVRAVLEGFLVLLIAVILFSCAALMGISDIPADPLSVLSAFSGLWLLGLGYGLCVSVTNELVPELGKIIDFAMIPMNIASGAIFPLHNIPQPYRSWLYLNPVADALEAAREAVTPYYQVVPESSLSYVYFFALVIIFFGLTLQIKYAEKLIAR